MRSLGKLIALLGLLANATTSAFTLTNPPAMEPDSVDENMSPCGGGTVTESSNFTEWPNAGRDIKLTNVTGTASTFFLNVALVEDITNFVTLYSNIPTHQTGDLCFPRIHGFSDENWLGKDAIFQIVQYAGNGVRNYQCSAIKFVLGDPAPNVCSGGDNPPNATTFHRRRVPLGRLLY
ncbi:hypothetical protein F5Y19DRAFT_480822 [Xylariaceae sp. FL1651]|nr:hypothetical protein F5Y19DRAFT_480822 [Xylariaceae sp. FL1651]